MFSTFRSVRLFATVSTLILLGTSWVSMQDSVTDKNGLDNPKLDKLKLQPGFKAEHLYSPSENGEGSWVSLTFDDKGRMITSDQYGFLYRLELPPIGSGGRPKIEKMDIIPVDAQLPDSLKNKVNMGYAQGLLWAFNSLYVMVNHNKDGRFPKGSGLYRLQDTNGDDKLDKITLLKELKGEGEHGPHAIVLAPDKKSLYVMAGNFTDVPEMNAYRLPKVWGEDNLFPQIKDPRGHATDRMAPGGWIANVDSLGQNWELIGAGFRNSYDIAFNDAGDLFTYDSDMEWDFGLPWYKPTRILHITSGAEFGWRTGATSWSPTFADALPSVLNMGQGSPTGVFYGKDARFPQKYRQALYAFDWSFGIIYAIHMQPKGGSYTATAEEFISGAPLPVTDGVVGPDGAVYFLTGGRRLESDLYRVYYQGNESVTPVAAAPALPEEHRIRKMLEGYHGAPASGAVEAAWPYLNHPDRHVRYAARIAVEHQPVDQWQNRVFAETDPQRLTFAAIALARHGKEAQKSQLLNALAKINIGQLPEPQQLDLLRAYELVFARMGMPDPADKEKVIAVLNPNYPAKTALLNRGYSKLLVFLEAPGVAEKTLALLDKKEEAGSEVIGGAMAMNSSDLILRNPQYGLDIARLLSKLPPAQQTYYATMLSSLKSGWTPELRDRYFKWFTNAFTYQGGRSYIGFIDRARKLALNNVPKEEADRYNKLSGEGLVSSSGNDLVKDFSPKGPGRNWKLENALAVVDSGLTNRNFDQGRKIYSAILCSHCHSMRGEGGDIGPDLTQLGTRFSSKDILEAIIHPNKAVSDQYASTIFYLKNGQSVLGRLVNEDKTSYTISQNPFAQDMVRKLSKKEVTSTKYATVSIMLPGLINSLNPNELRDLMAYLIAGGNQDHQVYKSEPGTSKGK